MNDVVWMVTGDIFDNLWLTKGDAEGFARYCYPNYTQAHRDAMITYKEVRTWDKEKGKK